MSESSKPLKFTLVRFASDPQSKSARKIVPTQSDVFLGELLGLDAHLTCALREPCSKVVLRVEALIDGGRSDQIFSNSANPWDILVSCSREQFVVRCSSFLSTT